MARRGEDLSNVEFETSEDVQVVPTFNSMGLREELLRAIYAYGKSLENVDKKHGDLFLVLFCQSESIFV